jgi:predicted PurR-regulated permease PerM
MSVTARRDWPTSVLIAARLVSFAVICAVLFWAQVVLIPIALAALVAFVLAPAVTRLQRIGLPRIPAVFVVVALVSLVLGGIGWVVVGELSALAAQLPTYRANIREKITDIREFTRGGTIETVQETIEDIGEDLERVQEAEAPRPSGEQEPLPVTLAPENSWGSALEGALPVLEAAATAGLAMLLAIFMLIQREDVRNRVVSLAGQAALVTTTKAFAEAGARISRYLLMQLVINGTMGVAVWLGLYFIGVPYSALWGLSAAVLRYIPYIGPWIAALLPISVSLITSPEWTDVLLVVALFVTLELLSNNVMEPLLYGQSVGLSPIAVIVAVIFWTWIWGAVGLVLATPLTVCLVVIGKYISGLAVFDRLLGERPPLQPHLWLYQRLLARDEGEASEVLAEYADEHTLEETCDELLLRTLLTLKHDLAAERIAAADGDFVVAQLREIIDGLAEKAENANAPSADSRAVGLPPQDRLDEVALELLRLLLGERKCKLETLSSERLIGERIAAVEQQAPPAVCMVSLPPGDLAATRRVCKRLRTRLADVPVLVGRFGTPAGRERGRQALVDAGVDRVTDTLTELRDAVLQALRERVDGPNAAPEPPPVATRAASSSG